MKKDKDRRVKNEIARIESLFTVTETERTFIAEQIRQLAWYNVSIKDLQRDIDKAGSIVDYCNGSAQYGTRKNPDIDTLIQYQKQSIAISSALAKFLKCDDSQKGGKLAAILSGEEWP